MRLDLERLGAMFKELRTNKKWTQQTLAERLEPNVSRTTIALFEQGRRLPPLPILEQIANHLDAPRNLWEPFLMSGKPLYREFESLLSELVGRPLALERLQKEAIETAHEAIDILFSEELDDQQAYDMFNRIMVYYNVTKLSPQLFARYFANHSMKNIDAFREGIERYQKDVIRLFSTFAEAYRIMNSTQDLQSILAPLSPRDDDKYKRRKEWQELQLIEENRLPDLGYISAVRIKQELKEREVLSRYLKELAEAIRERGSTAVAEVSILRQRKMDALLRKFDSKLPHGPISPLFSPDPGQLLREAERIAPSGQGDLERIAWTQRKGLANLARYLTSDYMDVYIATSMRTEADFVSVNRFVNLLFQHERIKPLKLRYFNPTQSWIEDRVAKGLVEALMLRRADFTFYMAQKTDTFGKDSEASVALGQGKPVIVYVPRLYIPEANIDTDALARCNEETLKQMIQAEGDVDQTELDDTVDAEGLHGYLLALRLQKLSDEALARAVKEHWADFDLFSEAERIADPAEREAYGAWINRAIHQEAPFALAPSIREQLRTILIATAMRFERRARLFREVHPLALQVILSTGVLNGMLVARSIDTCAALLQGLIQNRLTFALKRDQDNYRLVELLTHSTVRVIPRNQLIANAFEAFYTTMYS